MKKTKVLSTVTPVGPITITLPQMMGNRKKRAAEARRILANLQNHKTLDEVNQKIREEITAALELIIRDGEGGK